MVYDVLPLTLVLTKKDSVKEVSTTSISLIEICNKLLFVV